MTVYPTIEEVLLLHSRLLERFGGMPGLRDRGGLEAALARPQGYYNDLIEEAAALCGNKRVAITVTAAFLRANGYRLEFDDLETYRFLTKPGGSNSTSWNAGFAITRCVCS